MKRIVTLTTSRTGGGGLAALNLVEELQRADYDLVVISRENANAVFGTGKLRARMKTQISKVFTFLNRLNATKQFGFVSPHSFGYVSYNSIIRLNPDVVHIHNWYNLISVKTLRKLIENQNIVMTAHDARILSGACHVLLECREFRHGCTNCPAIRIGKSRAEKSWRILRKAMNSAHNLTIVSPSRWLELELTNTMLPNKNIRIAKIQNIISNEYFSQDVYLPKNELRKILFISADLNSEFKGGKVLVDAMRLVAEKDSAKHWQVTLVGNGDMPVAGTANLEFTKVSFSSQEELLDLYKSSDLLVIPSSFDNFPTVAIEAQLSGLPVLGTRVGGIPEILQDGKYGFLCDFDRRSIAEAISTLSIKELNKIGKQAFVDAKSRFSNLRIISEYESVLHEQR